MTKTEWKTLEALDTAVFEDAERGGDGWAQSAIVAAKRGISNGWVQQQLARLEMLGYVERRRDWVGYRLLWVYAPTEKGAELLEGHA